MSEVTLFKDTNKKTVYDQTSRIQPVRFLNLVQEGRLNPAFCQPSCTNLRKDRPTNSRAMVLLPLKWPDIWGAIWPHGIGQNSETK